MALDQHQAGRRDEAKALYQQALSLTPEDPTTLYLFGLFSFEGGDAETAERQFQRLADVAPRNPDAHVALANLWHWQGRLDAACEHYRRAISLAPQHEPARTGLITALIASGDTGAAITEGQDAVSACPGSISVLSALGAALTAANDAKAAATVYATAADLAPDDPTPRIGRVRALIQLSDLAQALSEIEAALLLDATSVDAWLLMGTILSRLGRTQEAVNVLSHALTLDPENTGALVRLGACLIAQDRPNEALQHLAAALQHDPALPEAHANLSSLYMRAGKPDEARHHARCALDLEPDSVVAHQNLAAMAEEAGDMEEARTRRERIYRRQNLFTEYAPDARASVLMLTAAGQGNVPNRDILPKDRYTRHYWYIEYATPDQAAKLPPYDIVFNTVGDADLAGPTEGPIHAFLQACHKPVLNRPASVMRTKRHDAPELMAGIDNVVTPPVRRASASDIAQKGLAGAVADLGVSPPLLVRPMGSHGGKGLILVQGSDDLASLTTPPGEDVYVTAFHDFQSADGWWRKYRVIFIDRRPYAYHLAISAQWLVHHETARMNDDPGRLAEELAFLAAPGAVLGQAGMDAIEAIGRRMDLDYCGVDFSILPDGRLLVFEANATMLTHMEAPDGPLAHKNPYVARICEAFQTLVHERIAQGETGGRPS